MNPEDREAWEERAAIREYEGQNSRHMAEILARQDLERMKKPQRELFEYEE